MTRPRVLYDFRIAAHTINNLLARRPHLLAPSGARDGYRRELPRSDIFPMDTTIYRLLAGEYPSSDPTADAKRNFTAFVAHGY
jgi:hypothetical protein